MVVKGLITGVIGILIFFWIGNGWIYSILINYRFKCSIAPIAMTP